MLRIVLVRLSALGDIIHAWPLAEAIRAGCPDCHLTWVVEQPFRVLVEGHPAVDEVVTTATRRWRSHPFAAATRTEVQAVKQSLRSPPADVCIDAQGLVKSALICRWTRCQRRVGLARPWRREILAGLGYTETIEGAEKDPHVVATNVQLAAAAGAAPPPSSVIPNGRWLLAGLEGRSVSGSWSTPFAVVLPGAGEASKILPVSTLAEVAVAVAGSGLSVVVAWGPGEKGRAEAVVEAAGEGVFLAPPTDIGELASLLGGAAVVIGGDTGPVHLAASFGTPTLAVFLTTDWRRNGPLGDAVAVISGTAEPAARPSGSARATQLRQVGAAEIVDSVQDLLTGSAEHSVY